MEHIHLQECVYTPTQTDQLRDEYACLRICNTLYIYTVE